MLFTFSEALDTTIADLLGKEVPNPKSAVPEQLKNLAEIDKLPTRDVETPAQSASADASQRPWNNLAISL